MSEQVKENVGTVEQGQQQVQTATQEPAQQATTPATQTATEPPKQNWLKKHWKGVTAGAAAVVTAVSTAFVAYKKGKAAGIMSVPQPEPEDYSLDPNK